MQPSTSGSTAGRILRNAYWAVVFGMPLLALVVPDLWETYFIIVIGGMLTLAPYWRAHLFRLKVADSGVAPAQAQASPASPSIGYASRDGQDPSHRPV